MNNIKKSVTTIMVVFLFLFVALIGYIAYFQVIKAPQIAEKDSNPRLWAARNEVLRGTIYSRDMKPLTKTTRNGDSDQKIDYLYGPQFAHTIGYMSPKFGLTGIQKAYDKELSTYTSEKASVLELFKDFSFDKFKDMFLQRDEGIEKKIGNGIVTTLDLKLQQTAYKALGNRVGAVVAIDPKTGQVLAMASTPTFNPNKLEEEMKSAKHGSFLNKVTQGAYPPGSTFKIVTAASALDNMDNAKTRIFNDNGKITFKDGKTLNNSGNASYGPINMKKGFIVSSNVVFGTLAMELGNTELRDTAEMFGFNEDIPAIGFNIRKSEFPKIASNRPGEIAQSGIGQGAVIATPMQMALVASTIANDGILMEPKLANSIVDSNKKTLETIPNKKLRKVMTKQDAEVIKNYMVDLVNSNVSRGRWSYFKGYDVAGKTGTADYRKSDGSLGTPHSWFTCFAPANNPKIAIAVIVEQGGYGAGAATDVAGQMIQTYLGNNK